MRPGMIDKDLAHQMRREAEELRPAIPLGLFLVHQA
jgi:hypothetical protein